MKNDKFKMRHRNIGQMYTRKEYIKRVPDGKERQMKWTYGDINKQFQHELHLVSTNEKLLSINSIDAVRTAIGHVLKAEETMFYMRIYPYPHHLLREHGLLGVAKAERLAKGMKLSFGKTSTKVAHVRTGQVIITLRCDQDLLAKAKKALDIASKKLSCSTRIIQNV